MIASILVLAGMFHDVIVCTIVLAFTLYQIYLVPPDKASIATSLLSRR
jgi:hypothetical protein